jgi:hypothetical protein
MGVKAARPAIMSLDRVHGQLTIPTVWARCWYRQGQLTICREKRPGVLNHPVGGSTKWMERTGPPGRLSTSALA